MESTLIHLHIPRTAGGTVSRLIYVNEKNHSYSHNDELWIHHGIFYYPGPNGLLGFFKEEVPGLCKPAVEIVRKHKLTSVIGHFPFGIHEFLSTPFTYITLLRHPVDRIVSLYYTINPAMGLQEFMNRFTVDGRTLDQTRVVVDNDQTRRISGMEPPFGKCHKEMLDVAKANLEQHFSLVGVTELFDEFLVMLSRERLWTKVLRYWPLHANSRRMPASSLDPSDVAAIEARNALDMELYRFAKEHIEARIAEQDAQFDLELARLRERKQEWIERMREKNPEYAGRVVKTLERVVSDSQTRRTSD